MSLADALKATSQQLTKNKILGVGDPTIASDWGVGDVPGWIPSGITALDYLLGGGLPLGRFSELFSGQESEGKSTLAIHFAIQTQRIGGVVVWLESEAAIDKSRAARMGLDLNKAIIWGPNSCEDGFAFIETIMENLRAQKEYATVPILVVWDTIAAAPLRTELAGKEYAQGMAKKPRVLWAGCRQLTNKFGSSPSHLLFVNQSYASMSMWGPDHVAAGGKGIKFHSSIRLDLKRGKKIENSNGEFVGIQVKLSTVKNKVALPNRKVSCHLYGETGFDNVMSYAQLFTDMDMKDGLLQGGGWYTLCKGQEFEKKVRWAGIRDAVAADPRILEYWRLLVSNLWPLTSDRVWNAETETIDPVRSK